MIAWWQFRHLSTRGTTNEHHDCRWPTRLPDPSRANPPPCPRRSRAGFRQAPDIPDHPRVDTGTQARGGCCHGTRSPDVPVCPSAGRYARVLSESNVARCILKVKTMTSPISGDPRGLRVLAAMPNKAARTMFGQPTPSFDKPWAIAWFGDYTSDEDVFKALRGIGKTLRRMGYSDFEIVE